MNVHRRGEMTTRARVYIGITAGRHFVLGWLCLLLPGSFASSSYAGVKAALPFSDPNHALQAWGLIFVATGLLLTYAAWSGQEGEARWALLVSICITALWVGGFLAALTTGDLIGPTHPVIWTAIALKDATMLRAPLRNPFENLTREVMAGDRAR